MSHFSHISSYILYISSILYTINYRAFLSSFWMAVGSVKAEPGAGCKGGSFGADLPWESLEARSVRRYEWLPLAKLEQLDEIVTPCAKGPAAKACMESVLAPDFKQNSPRMPFAGDAGHRSSGASLRSRLDIRFSHYDQIPIPN